MLKKIKEIFLITGLIVGYISVMVTATTVIGLGLGTLVWWVIRLVGVNV